MKMKKMLLLLTAAVIMSAALLAYVPEVSAEGGVTTVTLYKKYSDRGVFSKYGETFKSEWRTGSDITSVYPIASTAQEIKIDGRHYQDVWKEAWNAFEGSSSCKICYRVRFGTSDGKNFDKMIMKPGDELDYREYLENYIYDDIRVEKGVWYSHLEPDETGDLTLSSMKVTAGEKVDYINTPIIITACVYKSAADFDGNGFYTGSVSDTVTLVRSAVSLGVNVDSGGANLPLLRDRDDYTGYGFDAGETVAVRSERPVAGLYIQWDGPVKEWTLTYDGKNATFGKNGFLHEYVEIPGGAKECTINIPATTRICEIYAFSEGELPDWVQRWEKPLEKADLLVFSTHADDEVLFFGGAVTLYCALGYRTQVVYMCNYWNGEKTREHEKLDGLWTMGVRNYPVNMDFDDHYAESLENAKTIYNYEKLTAAVADNIRRFKPQVIVSHDINGEYGHGGHIILCAALREAVEKTADAAAWKESADKYGTWDVPKTYLHLYGENKLRLDLRQSMDVLNGLTPLEVEKNAYLKHESQQWTWFYVDDEYQYSCADFGLYRTTVGNDSGKNDMMENIVSYEEQDELERQRLEEEERQRREEEERKRQEEEERKRLEEEERLRREEEERKKREEEENSSKPAATPDPRSGEKPPENKNASVVRTLAGVIMILLALVLSIFVLGPALKKLLRNRKK